MAAAPAVRPETASVVSPALSIDDVEAVPAHADAARQLAAAPRALVHLGLDVPARARAHAEPRTARRRAASRRRRSSVPARRVITTPTTPATEKLSDVPPTSTSHPASSPPTGARPANAHR